MNRYFSNDLIKQAQFVRRCVLSRRKTTEKIKTLIMIAYK